MNKWLDLLKSSKKSVEEFGHEPMSNLEYLCDQIFDVTTYDSGQSELIGKKCVEVSIAITKKETFEYIKDEANYTWYLMLCNIDFFAKRIDWGGSIRGAWWDTYHGTELNTCGMFDSEGEYVLDIKFTRDEWDEFIMACAAFAELDNESIGDKK